MKATTQRAKLLQVFGRRLVYARDSGIFTGEQYEVVRNLLILAMKMGLLIDIYARRGVNTSEEEQVFNEATEKLREVLSDDFC